MKKCYFTPITEVEEGGYPIGIMKLSNQGNGVWGQTLGPEDSDEETDDEGRSNNNYVWDEMKNTF